MSNAMGFKSYVILAPQTAWDTPAIDSEIYPFIYEFVSCGLKNNSDWILAERFKGQPSPTPGIENFYDASGDLVMHLHADDMLWWWLLAMFNDTPDTDASAPQEVRAAATWDGTDSLTTQPSATTIPCDPGILELTVSEAISGTFTIAGTDQNGVAISEIVTFSAQAVKATTKYFQTVNTNGITTAVTCGGKTLAITCNRGTYTHIIALGDDVPVGYTMELVKGGIPSVYVGCIPNTITIDLADVLTFNVGLMAKMGYNARKLSADTDARTPVVSNTGTDVAAVPRVSELVFPSWGIVLQIDKGSGYATIPVSSLSLSLDNALKFPDRFRNLRTRPQPVRGGNRNYSLRVGIDYSTTENDWDPKFMGNAEVGAKVICYRTPYADAEYKIEFNLPRCQITSFPDPAVSDYSEIIQDINLRPIRSLAAVASDELSVVLTCLQSGA